MPPTSPDHPCLEGCSLWLHRSRGRKESMRVIRADWNLNSLVNDAKQSLLVFFQAVAVLLQWMSIRPVKKKISPSISSPCFLPKLTPFVGRKWWSTKNNGGIQCLLPLWASFSCQLNCFWPPSPEATGNDTITGDFIAPSDIITSYFGRYFQKTVHAKWCNYFKTVLWLFPSMPVIYQIYSNLMCMCVFSFSKLGCSLDLMERKVFWL